MKTLDSKASTEKALVHKPIDGVFRQRHAPTDFNFGEKVAAVFDDMLDRSVPFYAEMQRMIVEMAGDCAVDGSAIYDLGCSTGNTLLKLHPVLPKRVRLVGVDNSQEMLKRCREKLASQGVDRKYELRCEDLNNGVHIDDASMVLLVLTLQFVRPLNRDALIAKALQGLRKNGVLILVEKVLGEDSLFNRLFIRYYYELKKRHGYSALEIAQKREALENVLVPYKLNEDLEMLKRAGFRYTEVFFKWYNFCGIVALK